MKRLIVGFFALAIAQVLGGCQKNEFDTATGLGGGSGNGTIVVRLTDGPGAYEAVYIVVDSVRVHFESGDTVSGWYTISRIRSEYDLLAYANGKDTIIAESPIPAGYYSQIRLYIGSGSHIAKGGSTSPLEIPSGSQSGLKLNIQANILPGTKYELMLDFDAGQSIVVTGNGRFKLKPVIKVVTTAISGSLTGVVMPDTTDATVWAIAGADTSTTLADTTGLFKFRYLTPGIYILKIVPADITYWDTTLTNVPVAAAQNTDIGTITLRKK